jgi:DNA polymerase III subunit gamma/tau
LSFSEARGTAFGHGMSYLVLARKYRPTTFSEVVGQEHVTRTLANAFATGRVHHAFLFCGPRGVGKTTLARILGKALNCVNGPTAEPCGVCSACTSITAGSAVDYIEMDGASNRGIDAIRELTDAVRYQPAALRKKVYVIDEVHMLTTEAFNALLKTLEEPPPHVTFVLATTEPHKLPNTILSRCQRYDFKLVPATRLAQHLTAIFGREDIAVAAGAVSLIVRESGGSVRDSLSLCDQVISYVGAAAITEAHVAEVLGVADRALTRSLVSALAAGDASGALHAADSAVERGVDEVQLARAVVRYLRDLAVLQAAPGATDLVDAADEERDELVAEAARLAPSRVTQMFERMLRCADDLGKTLQPRLVLDFALIDVATLEPLVPLGDLLARLGELEQRLGGSGGAPRPRPGQGSGPGPSRPSPASPSVAPAMPRPQRPVPGPGGPPEGPTSSAPARTVSPSPSPTPSPSPSPPPPPPPLPSPSPSAQTRPAAPPAYVARPGVSPAVIWDDLLRALEAKRAMLAGQYEHARVLSITPDAIEVGFPEEAHLSGELALAPDAMNAMKAFLRDHFGRPVALSIKLLSAAESAQAPARSLVEATREKAVEERRKRETEAREHPVTKLVLETFGAQIKEIKTDV